MHVSPSHIYPVNILMYTWICMELASETMMGPMSLPLSVKWRGWCVAKTLNTKMLVTAPITHRIATVMVTCIPT